MISENVRRLLEVVMQLAAPRIGMKQAQPSATNTAEPRGVLEDTSGAAIGRKGAE